MKFHHNAQFTPSRDFNADDVIFSFQRQRDPNHPYHKVSGGTYANFESLSFRSLITAIDKPDDYTVRFTLSHAEAPFLADLAWYFASILSAEYADQMLKAGTPEKVDLEPIGTGPFQLAQYQKDSRILYQAFPDYWQGKAKLDRLVFSITPDASVRYAKLRKNECQVMPFPNPAELADMKNNKDITLMQKAGLNIGFLAFNTRKAPLDNVKGASGADDGDQQTGDYRGGVSGHRHRGQNLLPPGVWSAATDLKDDEYDPKARALLKEAGLAEGTAIDLWAMPVQRPYNPNARRMAEMIQADWAKVG